jgi:membrane-bound metal-dependent hydrolase YbcI (DUF457 family)
MSWAAHDLEPYTIQRHFGRRVAIIPLLIGSYAPDMLTKWFVYGTNLFGYEIKAEDPAQFHRGWPGGGFTHSLMFGVVVALAIYLVFNSKVYSFSFLLGQWAHSLTDMGDTVGTMLLFPFTTHQFAVGAWAYAGQLGRTLDAGAYFSGLGFVWDGIWIAMGLINWRVLTRDYFYTNIRPVDPSWQWMGQRLPEPAVLALYRGSFCWGTFRWTAWVIWAHVIENFPFSLEWGGPAWVPDVGDVVRRLCTCPCGCGGAPT